MNSEPNGAAAPKDKTSNAPSGLAEAIAGPADALRGIAGDGRLTEDLALKLLERRDLPAGALEALATNVSVMKHRRVIVALVSHPKTPRFISLPNARRLYTFELMKVVQTPALAADLKLAIEEAMIARLGTTSSGERRTLAKQGSTRVAAALLVDADARVMRCALENPRVREVEVVRALMREGAPQALVSAVCEHPRWSLRREVQIALLRNEHTPFGKVLHFAKMMPRHTLLDVLQNTRLAVKTKSYLKAELDRRRDGRPETDD